MTKTGCIILAAGEGTRMKSALPKVMHKLAGQSLIGHVLTTVSDIGAGTCAVVVGPGMEMVANEARGFLPEAQIFTQHDRRGTADAVAKAEAGFAGFDGTILILYGDVPLVGADSLRALAQAASDGETIAVLGFRAADPTGYGRLICDRQDRLTAIREELDASAQERAIDLCNSGIMAMPSRHLWRLIGKIGNDNAKGEFYLTDLIALAGADGVACVVRECGENEVAGVNTRVQLAALEGQLQRELRQQAMLGGATLIDPETTYLSADTKIGCDVTIEPNVFIGPGTTIEDGATIRAFSHIEQTHIGRNVIIGPFVRLRGGTELAEDVRVGNFVEMKNAHLDKGTKAMHLTYLGDARLGPKVNVGAGTITCNYDGFDKHMTHIGAGAFIGSNSALVAPLTIGEGAYIGSGSVITKDVPGDALAVGRGRQEMREGWAARYRQKKSGSK